MDPLPAPPRRLYVDMTSALQERGRIAHGTIRVERGIVTALAGAGVAMLEFCHYDHGNGRFALIASEHALEIATARTLPEPRRNPQPAWRSHTLLRAGKRAEIWLRHNVRDRLRARRSMQTADTEPPLFAPGSTLLLPGELQRQDFAVLMRHKRQLNLRLAFVFYDLLGVLPADDPRLRDPRAHDLPSTDFLVREAEIVLAISRYSRRVLLDHIASRGVQGPRVEVIRLGGALNAPASEAGPNGLRAGGFVLTVGDVVPRKNHDLLIKVWKRLLERCPLAVKPLVIAGRISPEARGLADRIAADPRLRPHVLLLNNADDRELGWLYANCLFTVFPSFMEGYGLPVAESLAAGKLCIASSATSIPEASQGCGVHLDPTDLESWAGEIERLLSDPIALKHEAARVSRFQPWTWNDTAADILRLLA